MSWCCSPASRTRSTEGQEEKYAAHDEANLCKTGDMVRIEECPPISKRKTWLVVERNGSSLKGEALAKEGAAA